VLAVLNVRTGELQFSNAGHPAPFLLSERNPVTPLYGHGGVALGAWRGMKYQTTTYQLEPGDTLLFFTDGITEALNPEEQFYTAARLQRVLEGLTGRSANDVSRAVIHDVRTFGADHEQADDLTILTVRWLGGTLGSTSRSEAQRETNVPIPRADFIHN
jgi:sigma-B regulation protein RsbU (phosphoserine phosphatase)